MSIHFLKKISCDNLIQDTTYFPTSGHGLNSHDHFFPFCFDVVRRKSMLITLGTKGWNLIDFERCSGTQEVELNAVYLLLYSS